MVKYTNLVDTEDSDYTLDTGVVPEHNHALKMACEHLAVLQQDVFLFIQIAPAFGRFYGEAQRRNSVETLISTEIIDNFQ